MGQFAGDSLGSLVEFDSASQVADKFPEGVRDMADGGHWNTKAGQPTDDSEMALKLARSLVREGTFDVGMVRQAYLEWIASIPFDVGNTIGGALRRGYVSESSQANGALMRISPLGIFGARWELDVERLRTLAQWAMDDAEITHVHPICKQANALFACAIAVAIRKGLGASELYEQIECWARDWEVDERLSEAIAAARDTAPPILDGQNIGWVILAFQNALWQLLHAPNLEEAIVGTVGGGGDTDTTAAICGALMGAVYGVEAIPERWRQAILSCRPESGRPDVHRPRPAEYWPTDALQLAAKLVSPNRTSQCYPIEVAAISPVLSGRVGVTLCPGKHQDGAWTGTWRRDLALDLDSLREEGWTHVISLVEEWEMGDLKVPNLGAEIEARGMIWCHFPIPDGSPPSTSDLPKLADLRAEWRRWLAEGHSILVHCKGGLGRAGTIAAVLLVDSGFASDPEDAIRIIRKYRSPHAVDPAQIEFLKTLMSLQDATNPLD